MSSTKRTRRLESGLKQNFARGRGDEMDRSSFRILEGAGLWCVVASRDLDRDDSEGCGRDEARERVPERRVVARPGTARDEREKDAHERAVDYPSMRLDRGKDPVHGGSLAGAHAR